MDLYDDWVITWQRHYEQKHQLKSVKYVKDWSCTKCYLEKDHREIPAEFVKFWNILKNLVPEITGYNWNTIKNFYGLMDDDNEEDDTKKKRAIFVMIQSMRYKEKPTKTYRRIESEIEMIIGKCVQKEGEDITIGSIEDLKNEIENDN